MAKCNFRLYIYGEVEDFIKRVKKELKNVGGMFTGNSNSGSISISTSVGKIRGYYKISGNDIEIEITEKPFLASCGMIESKIKEFI